MLMDNSLLILVATIVIGLLFFSVLFLPRIKITEEKEQISLHTEYCTVTRYFGIFAFGSPFSFLSKRVSFYDKFFVIAGMTGKKFTYSDIKSVSFKRNWLSKSVALNFINGQSIVLNPSNIDKVQSLIEPRVHTHK